MRATFAVVLAGSTLFLAACGIKGPLYLPPTATSHGKAAPDAPAVTPAADVNAQPGARPASEASPETGDALAPAQETPQP